MKQYILSFIILLFSLNLVAQRPGQRLEEFKRFKSEKIAYVTEQLELTPEEAQNFWPLYNEMEKKRLVIYEDGKKYLQQYKEEGKKMKDKELAELSIKIVDLKVREANLQKEYFTRYLDILPAEKVVKLHLSEKNFRRHLMHKYRRGQER